jgi:hypothetical protein
MRRSSAYTKPVSWSRASSWPSLQRTNNCVICETEPASTPPPRHPDCITGGNESGSSQGGGLAAILATPTSWRHYRPLEPSPPWSTTFGAGGADELEHLFVTVEGLGSLVFRDLGEQAVLDGVPTA